MDTTMNRTKKYLAYFGKSFFRDKIAITFVLLIVLTLIAIIYAAILPDKNERTESVLPQSNDNPQGTPTAQVQVILRNLGFLKV